MNYIVLSEPALNKLLGQPERRFGLIHNQNRYEIQMQVRARLMLIFGLTNLMYKQK